MIFHEMLEPKGFGYLFSPRQFRAFQFSGAFKLRRMHALSSGTEKLRWDTMDAIELHSGEVLDRLFKMFFLLNMGIFHFLC